MSYEDLYVVGIGASAGGFEALSKFLQRLPRSPFVTYVIAQHLDPKQPTLLGELLSKYTHEPLVVVCDGDKVRAGKVYYCPPNKDVSIDKGIFKLSQPPEKHYPKPSVNTLLTSLAQEKGNKAIGIILSGTGSDGAKGVEAIAKHGGIALAEDEGAKYFSMPKAAIDTGCVIVSLPPELLAEGIEEVIVDRDFFGKQLAMQDSTQQVFEILNKKTGVDFSSYKEATILRRLRKRMNEVKCSSIGEYLTLLGQDDHEVEQLKNEMLIIVTSFFRGDDAFFELEKHLITLVKESKKDVLRVWVSACATGEEAYSIAIMLCEIQARLGIYKKVTIFATDIVDSMINSNRVACYKESAVESLPLTLREKYFTLENGCYKPASKLREMVIFSTHDLIKDPPFLNMDLVTCRNVLIYFDNQLQDRIINIFYYAMRLRGLLFLGQSETIGNLTSLFSIVSNKHRIYRKSNDVTQFDMTVLSYDKNNNIATRKKVKKEREKKALNVDAFINRVIADHFSPVGVVISADGNNILYYRGDSGAFFKQPTGLQTSNIHELIVDYLKLDLRATISLAIKKNSMSASKRIRVFPVTEPKEYVLLRVFPLEPNRLGDKTLFVGFESVIDDMTNLFGEDFEPILTSGNEVNVLEDELISLKERLQITIEELETSNEEQQSTNEELQSTNEELQSSNEELETSNEELQSTNEELQTVNDELNTKQIELEFALQAFSFAGVDAGVLVFDRDLNIITHSGDVSSFFNLDMGPVPNAAALFMHSGNSHLSGILTDIKNCLQKGREISKTLSVRGHYYHFRVNKIQVPSRNRRQYEDGLVLSFVDKTEIFEKEEQQILQENRKIIAVRETIALREMIANIAHQWRQPLNNISLLNTLLVEDYYDKTLTDKSVADFSEKTNETLQYMSKTIDDFRDFFKPEKNKVAFSVAGAVRKALNITISSLESKGVLCKFILDKGDATVYGYPNEFSQAIINIINNAKDAIVERNVVNGEIVISLDKRGSEVTVKISDNGKGVDDRIIDNIFQPYFTTKFKARGTGIGLYMAHNIIENNMEGSLTVRNGDEGAEFTIVLQEYLE